MKILDSGRLTCDRDVVPGDTLMLMLDGNIIHQYEIFNKVSKITHWAAIQIGYGVGYFVGDDNLIAELEALINV